MVKVLEVQALVKKIYEFKSVAAQERGDIVDSLLESVLGIDGVSNCIQLIFSLLELLFIRLKKLLLKLIEFKVNLALGKFQIWL